MNDFIVSLLAVFALTITMGSALALVVIGGCMLIHFLEKRNLL